MLRCGMFLLLASLDAEAGTPADLARRALDRPTCFPITEAVRVDVMTGRWPEVPVFVEEDSWCHEHSVRHPPAVPADLVGEERLRFILDTLSAPLRDPPRYVVVPRAGGWLVAPAGRDPLSDSLVALSVDSGSPVQDAVDRLMAQVRVAANPMCGCDGPVLQEDLRVASSMVDAFRALHGARPMGYALQLSRPGRASFVTFTDPDWGVAGWESPAPGQP